MSDKSKKIVALILAAGESSRLGQPKQNLLLGNTTILNHSKQHLNLENVERTFIVLGAYADVVREKSKLNEQEVIEFSGWAEGMGSSLAYACKQIFSEKEYDGILITLCDLPLVKKEDYMNMCGLFESPGDIIATKTQKGLGAPAIFGSDYFDNLVQLKGKRGAKSIIEENRDKINVYFNDRAKFDIDTPESYRKIMEHNI